MLRGDEIILECLEVVGVEDKLLGLIRVEKYFLDRVDCNSHDFNVGVGGWKKKPLHEWTRGVGLLYPVPRSHLEDGSITNHQLKDAKDRSALIDLHCTAPDGDVAEVFIRRFGHLFTTHTRNYSPHENGKIQEKIYSQAPRPRKTLVSTLILLLYSSWFPTWTQFTKSQKINFLMTNDSSRKRSSLSSRVIPHHNR